MEEKHWTPCHVHSCESNSSYFEIVTQYEDYVEWAKEHGQHAICVTNHGNVVRWIKHKEQANEAGLKYIHGIEAYVCMDLEDKYRFHTIIIAKNYEGVKEINRLSSNSFNRKDGHYYYKPRILFDELWEAVDHGNVYVTTACLAGGLAQSYSDNNKEVMDKWIDLVGFFPDRVFLEVQPHDNDEQKQYNRLLVNLARKNNFKLIAANDIHALNPYHDKLRKIIKKGKGAQYDNEDDFELWCKTYDEMVEAFKDQGILSDQEIEDALDLTNEIAASVEDFDLDKSHKYPKLYDDPEGEFQKRVKQGLKDRGILDLPEDERKKYFDRVKNEYAVYKHNGAIDYMLSHEDIVNAAKKHGAHFGPGRGSVSGSLIAYLCGQTEMDSVKHGLNFERFMNPERISLADIDVDLMRDNQQWLQKWILTNSRWHAASILTTNTYGFKAAIKAIADGLPRYAGKPQYIQSIRNQIDDKGNYSPQLYEEHRELIDYAKDVVGVIDSFGRHAAGIVIDTNTIDDAMGTQTISGWDYPVTQITMKEIDHYNWVKYDLLGLDNVGLIERAAELAGLPYPTPDSDFIDFEDENVWASMRDNNIGVFQMESDRAGKLLHDMLSPETIKRIKSNEAAKDVKYMDLLSLVNAAQRPAGSSYVEQVTHGYFKDNGHPALNKFLAPTLGELCYQEQLIAFLVEFCGMTPGASDVLRRAVGKKNRQVIDKEVPKIHKRFIQTMVNKYNDSPEHAESIANDFMQVFMDAANYGFSINHSMAYSYIGYISTWLRYYYPLEWCTAAFEVWKGKQDKINRVVNFAKQKNIRLYPAEYGKSKGLYYFNREENAIYEGTSTIKGLNEAVGDALYEFCKRGYTNSFSCFLVDLFDGSFIDKNGHETPVSHSLLHYYNNTDEIDVALKSGKIIHMNSGANTCVTYSHVLTLTLLGFFKKFGPTGKLLKVYEHFRKNYKPKNKLYANKAKKFEECLNFEESLPDEELPITETLKNEYKLLGRCQTRSKKLPASYAFLTKQVMKSNRVLLRLYSVNKGTEARCFVSKSAFFGGKLKEGVLLKIGELRAVPKTVLVDGKWTKSTDKKDVWLKDFTVVA